MTKAILISTRTSEKFYAILKEVNKLHGDSPFRRSHPANSGSKAYPAFCKHWNASLEALVRLLGSFPEGTQGQAVRTVSNLI